MAREIPHSETFSGLSRKVIGYVEQFEALMGQVKQPGFSEASWRGIEELVDVDAFVRHGVFLTQKAETIGWKPYKSVLTQYAGGSQWEGTLRHITENGNRVILELTERSTKGETTHVANTVTIYEFNDAGRIRKLDVYVMSLN